MSSPLAIGSGKRSWRRRTLQGLLLVTATLIALRLLPHAPLSDAAPHSTAVYADRQQLLRLTLADDGQYRVWTPLSEIAPELVQATLLHEDRRFMFHPGIDPLALVRAALSQVAGGRRSGGSTLTMQLARRLYAIESRRPLGKLLQLAAAVWLELRHGKHEILEAYLNLAPYGGNIEGVGAASLIYFHKPAQRLSLVEALTLALVPQSPSRRGQALRRSLGAARTDTQPAASDGASQVSAAAPAPASLLAAREVLATRYARAHPGAAHELGLLRAPLALHTPGELPFLAPHFVDALLAQAPAKRALRTTLELSAQRLLERQVQRFIPPARRFGIHNAAAMLLDTRDMAVKALVGSADFFDDAIAGQVNGASARRSPGSTLKPFVYALGLEQGVIHERTVLRDVPTAFSAYTPENFDGRFVGPLSARDALIRSRNIPALAIAARLQRPSLHGFLREAGVALPHDEAHYGLGLALGGAELSMEELVTLYAMLANGGLLRPLRTQQGEPRPQGVRLLSPQSAFIVLDMLAHNPRPDSDAIAIAADTTAEIAWKTGTSWGFRDAWTIGVVGPYVLAVWIGDFAGQGNPAFVGLSAAAPLFFRIADALVARQPELAMRRRRPPDGLTRVAVCAESGQLPGPHCRATQLSWFIPGRSPIDSCQVHREIEVDAATGRQVCGTAVGEVRREVHEFWSSDMLGLFARAGLPRRPVPGPGVGCSERDEAPGFPPRITSPRRGVTYTLREGARDQAIALAADTDADARRVFWYVDRALAGSAEAGTPLWWKPAPGHYQLRAVDDRGRSDVRALHVELAP